MSATKLLIANAANVTSASLSVSANDIFRTSDGTVWAATTRNTSLSNYNVELYKTDSSFSAFALEKAYGTYTNPTHVCVTEDVNGVVHLSWMQRDSGASGIYYAKRVAGVWDGVVTTVANSTFITSGVTRPSRHSMMVDSNSIVHMISCDNADQGGQGFGGRMYYITNLSGSFVVQTIFTSGLTNWWVTACSATLDANGLIHAFYAAQAGNSLGASGTHWRYSTNPAGSSWPELNEAISGVASYEEIDSNGFKPVVSVSAFGVQLILDSQGVPNVVYKRWASISGDTQNGVTGSWIYILRDSANLWVNKEFAITQSGSIRVNAPSLSITKLGQVYVGGSRDALGASSSNFVDIVMKRSAPGVFAIDYQGDDVALDRAGVKLFHSFLPSPSPFPGILKNGWIGTMYDPKSSLATSQHNLIVSGDFEPDAPTPPDPPAPAAVVPVKYSRGLRVRWVTPARPRRR